MFEQVPPAEPAANLRAAAPATAWSADALVERLGGDEELARQLVALFIDECARMQDAVRESIAGGSADAVRRAAHAFKGSVSNFTDGGAMAAAFALEQMGRDDELENAPAVLAQLDREVEALLLGMRVYQNTATCAS
jgi:HPt (histidine-containing phosphotransfer) domain-containing protein